MHDFAIPAVDPGLQALANDYWLSLEAAAGGDAAAGRRAAAAAQQLGLPPGQVARDAALAARRQRDLEDLFDRLRGRVGDLVRRVEQETEGVLQQLGLLPPPQHPDRN